MKFSDMPYVRPDVEKVRAELDEIINALDGAKNADEQIALYKKADEIKKHTFTMATIASVRHTIDTRDEFYTAENDFMDANSPALQEKIQQILEKMLTSPFRAELEEKLGELFFRNLEIAARTFSPEIMTLMQEENALVSEYQALYASMTVEFDGKVLPITKLGPYKQSTDREIRRAAFEADGKCFDSHREKLDELYDKLIKNRTAQAKALGYENYVALGYDRLGRNCYDSHDVAAFRDQIAEDFVPVVVKVKETQEKRIGVDKLKFYDDIFMFPDGNPTPKGTSDEILAAGQEMYRELSPETAEFIDFMYENELFDVLAKEGKAPGGYCTDLADYKAPFIFSNFNGTAGDVDVLTHEAGHAFAFYRAARKVELSDFFSPTIEACEVHSMSMEFLTSAYHEKFFGDATRKYEISHLEDAVIFIPYGCMVDEFQHKMYENPDLTPAERNEVWLSLEKKYRPYLDFDNLPFYSRGGGWQRQLHIYMYPLYYIDYCMAQVVAFQFWLASLENKDAAWKNYLAFVDNAGTKTFEGLVKSANLELPYEKGAMKKIGEKLTKWMEENQL
ncbi:MAG: M3 family oligoendopeptidase [Clostridia bacterium]|nr:M3 family oligoendopeptidase [Clostridia bacterium]MBP3555844.1 M3 family oligoendopeptidase [Clostridia bacterium]